MLRIEIIFDKFDVTEVFFKIGKFFFSFSEHYFF